MGGQKTHRLLGPGEGEAVGDRAVASVESGVGVGEPRFQEGGHAGSVEVEQCIEHLPAKGSMHSFIGEDAVEGGAGHRMGGGCPHGAEEGHCEGLSKAECMEQVVHQLCEGAIGVNGVGELGEFHPHGHSGPTNGDQTSMGQLGVVELVAHDAVSGVEQTAGQAGGDAEVQHPRRDGGGTVLGPDPVGPFLVCAGGGHGSLQDGVVARIVFRRARSLSREDRAGPHPGVLVRLPLASSDSDGPSRLHRRLHVLPEGGLDLHTVYSGEALFERDWIGRCWCLPLVSLLPPGPHRLSLRFDPTPVAVPELLVDAVRAPLSALRAHPARHDGTLTALSSFQGAPSEGYRGALAPVSYFCSRALESLLDGPVHLRSMDQPAPGHLPPPHASLLACDIGVVVMLRVADGRLVSQRRGAQLDWRAGHRSVSASGSLEPGRDFQQAEVGMEGLLAGARRELAEELGVGGVHDTRRNGLRVRSLGIWRELQRGGKPELYVAASTPLTFSEVQQLHRGAPDGDESCELVALDEQDCAQLLQAIERAEGLLTDPTIPDGPVDLALVAALLLLADDRACP